MMGENPSIRTKLSVETLFIEGGPTQKTKVHVFHQECANCFLCTNYCTRWCGQRSEQGWDGRGARAWECPWMCRVTFVVKWLVFCLESRATTSSPLDCTRETLTDTLKLSFLSMFPECQAHCSTSTLAVSASCLVLHTFSAGWWLNCLCRGFLCLGVSSSPLSGPPFWSLSHSLCFLWKHIFGSKYTSLPTNKILITLVKKSSSDH